MKKMAADSKSIGKNIGYTNTYMVNSCQGKVAGIFVTKPA